MGDGVNNDMYSHISEVISFIMQYYPDEGLEKFEEVSNSIKYNNYRLKNPKKDNVVNKENSSKVVTNKDALDFLTKAKMMMEEKYDAGLKEEDKQYLKASTDIVIPNMTE